MKLKMKKYPIKIPSKDFEFLENTPNTKGTRMKKVAVDRNNKEAFFKYSGYGYITSELCSEKMCYEIAKVLGYKCAKIELAKDSDGNLGVLNYVFTDEQNKEHNDAISYLNIHEKDRPKFYTIENIKKELDNLDKNLFKDFIKIMVFDALVGEQDRHEENWGILRINDKYEFSPLYDNGCSLLDKFKDEQYAESYYNGKKSFDAFINKSSTLIYKDEKKKYKHFELIEYLNSNYHDIVQSEIQNLNKLNDKLIREIVEKIPDDLLTSRHKEYIILYLIKRRDILLNIK